MEGEGDAVDPAPTGSPEPANRPESVTKAKIDYDLGSDDSAADDEERQAAKPDPSKASGKVKARLYGGEEQEFTLEELQEQLNSEGREWTIGKEKKFLKWPEVQRMVEMSQGAFDKMREAAELRKQFEGSLERAKQEPDWFLREKLGIDPETWAAEQAYKRYQENAELEQLMRENPAQARARMEQRMREDAQRQAQYEQQRVENERRQQEAQRQQAEFRKQVPGFLDGAGVPHNDVTQNMFYRIGQKWAEVGQILPPEQVADMVRDEWTSLVTGHITKLDDDKLLEFLGKDMRKRLRALEAKQLKGQGQPTQQAAAPKPRQRPKDAEPISISQWAKRYSE